MQRAFALYAALVDNRYPVDRDLIEQKIYQSDASVKKSPQQNREWFLTSFKRDRALLESLGIRIDYVDDERGEGYLVNQDTSFAHTDFLFKMDEAACASLYLALSSVMNEPLFPLPQDLRLAQLRLAQLWVSVYGDDEVLSFSNRFDNELPQQQAEYAGLMFEAILQTRKVTLSYRNQAGDLSERILSPYGLSFFESRWYVVGHDSISDAQRVFALSRIEEAELAKEAFEHPKDFRISDHITLPFALESAGPLNEVSLIIDESQGQQVEAITRGKGIVQSQNNGTFLWTIEYADIDVLARYVVEHELGFADPECTEAKYLAEKLEGLIA